MAEAPPRWFQVPVAVSGGKVFVGQYGGGEAFAALNALTGKPVWKRDLGRIWASPECHGEEVFLGTTDGNFFCLRASDGAMIWRRRFGAGVYSAPALDDQAVYTGSWDGHYYALNREDKSFGSGPRRRVASQMRPRLWRTG